MRNIVRLFLLLFATLFASGAYAQLPEEVGLGDEDNLLKDVTRDNCNDHLWIFGYDNEQGDDVAMNNGVNSAEEKARMYRLIDGDSGTYTQSSWYRADDDASLAQFLDVYLKEPVQGPMIAYMQRHPEKDNAHVLHMDVWASDGSAVKHDLSEGNLSNGKADFWGWKKIATVSVSNPVRGGHGLTDIFYAEKPYKYFRFQVLDTNHGSRMNSFHMAEFGLYSLSWEQVADICNNEEYAETHPFSGICGENIHWNFAESSGLLTISGFGEMYDYEDGSGNSCPWSGVRDEIKSIQINEGITNTGNYAFCGCNNLTFISIPSSISRIGSHAFEGNCSLKNIICNNVHVPLLDLSAFNDCPVNEMTLYLPCGAAKSMYAAVDGWSDFKTIADEPSDNEIWYTSTNGKISFNFGDEMLSNTYENGIGIITFEGTVTSIGSGAFCDCSSLKNIWIPSSVTTIEEEAFLGCTNLESINIPYNVEYIEYDAFEGCSSIKDVYCQCMTIPEDFPFHYCPIDEATLHVPYGMKELYEDEYGWEDFGSIVEDIEVVVAPSPNNEIWYTSEENKIISPYNTDAFDANIESFTYKDGMGVITFDRDVTNIGYEAFYECRDLKSIVIPNSVTCIGSRAFSKCDNLKAIIIPSSVTSIECAAFESCRSLRNITIPSSVTSIDDYTFYSCGFATIAIPSSVTNIGHWAFSGCNGLTSICVSPDNKAYDSRDNCNAIINSQTNELIAGCKKTVIPNSVTSIGEGAFYYCIGLTSITMPDGVTSIGKSAFEDCYGLSSIVLPESVTSIGNYAFLSCRGLKDVYCMSKIVPSLGHGAFSDCPEATLHVSSGTKSLYEAADGWKDFGTIVEMEPDITDISAFPNILYTEQQEVFTGHEATLSIKLKNEASITAFQFDLQLPDGITVSKDANGKNQISLDASRKADDHTISTNVLEDGTVRVACLSLSSEPFNGNDGTVLNVTIDIPDGMTDGDYDLILKNIEMTAPDNQAYKVDLCKSTLMVSSYIPGDVNGDREITISDAVGIVNFVIMTNTEGLNEKAADANQDGSISITDAVYVVNMVIHADETNVKGELRETAPSSLALCPMNVVAGETFEMPVILNGTANSITAMQFDLTLPKGITLSGIKTDEEHTIAYQEQENGTIRVASLSVDNSTYSGNGDKSVVLLLEAAPEFKESVVSIDNSELVTPGLRASYPESVSALICGNATGIDGIHSTEDTDIYDLQGRKTQCASHGIYIQNGKKTAVK